MPCQSHRQARIADVCGGKENLNCSPSISKCCVSKYAHMRPKETGVFSRQCAHLRPWRSVIINIINILFILKIIIFMITMRTSVMMVGYINNDYEYYTKSVVLLHEFNFSEWWKCIKSIIIGLKLLLLVMAGIPMAMMGLQTDFFVKHWYLRHIARYVTCLGSGFTWNFTCSKDQHAFLFFSSS